MQRFVKDGVPAEVLRPVCLYGGYLNVQILTGGGVHWQGIILRQK